jgi:pteridine reductase
LINTAKTVLITGAARRIGAACARLLHADGCNVLLHYHQSATAAQALADELNQHRPHSAQCLHADLCQLAAIETLAEQAINVWGGVDALINNAAQFFPGSIGQVTESDWSLLMDSNLKAPFFLSQALAPALQARQGCVINISDIHAEKGLQGFAVYSISKAGLIAMTHCLAKELAPTVRVNAIAPGAILWPERPINDSEKAEIMQRIALQRCGEAMDIAKAVRYLLTDAGYVTGQTLTVDGGRHLFM